MEVGGKWRKGAGRKGVTESGEEGRKVGDGRNRVHDVTTGLIIERW